MVRVCIYVYGAIQLILTFTIIQIQWIGGLGYREFVTDIDVMHLKRSKFHHESSTSERILKLRKLRKFQQQEIG
jgi:hypothetical protein